MSPAHHCGIPFIRHGVNANGINTSRKDVHWNTDIENCSRSRRMVIKRIVCFLSCEPKQSIFIEPWWHFLFFTSLTKTLEESVWHFNLSTCFCGHVQRFYETGVMILSAFYCSSVGFYEIHPMNLEKFITVGSFEWPWSEYWCAVFILSWFCCYYGSRL